MLAETGLENTRGIVMGRGDGWVARALTAAGLALILCGCAMEGADRVEAPNESGTPQSPAANRITGTPNRSEAGLDWVEDYEAVSVSMVRGVAPAKAVDELTSGRARP